MSRDSYPITARQIVTASGPCELGSARQVFPPPTVATGLRHCWPAPAEPPRSAPIFGPDACDEETLLCCACAPAPTENSAMLRKSVVRVLLTAILLPVGAKQIRFAARMPAGLSWVRRLSCTHRAGEARRSQINFSRAARAAPTAAPPSSNAQTVPKRHNVRCMRDDPLAAARPFARARQMFSLHGRGCASVSARGQMQSSAARPISRVPCR
jgi:hypothetical protein